MTPGLLGLSFPIDSPHWWDPSIFKGHAAVYRFLLCRGSSVEGWYVGQTRAVRRRMNQYKVGIAGTDGRVRRALARFLDEAGTCVHVHTLERPRVGVDGPLELSHKRGHRRMLLEAAAIVEMETAYPGCSLNKPKTDTLLIERLARDVFD